MTYTIRTNFCAICLHFNQMSNPAIHFISLLMTKMLLER